LSDNSKNNISYTTDQPQVILIHRSGVPPRAVTIALYLCDLVFFSLYLLGLVLIRLHQGKY